MNVPSLIPDQGSGSKSAWKPKKVAPANFSPIATSPAQQQGSGVIDFGFDAASLALSRFGQSPARAPLIPGGADSVGSTDSSDNSAGSLPDTAAKVLGGVGASKLERTLSYSNILATLLPLPVARAVAAANESPLEKITHFNRETESLGYEASQTRRDTNGCFKSKLLM